MNTLLDSSPRVAKAPDVIAPRRFKGCELVFLSLLTLSACSTSGNGNPTEAKLVADIACLELGQISASEPAICHVTVTNRSETSVYVEGFQPSCGCVKVTPSTVRLAPNESRIVDVIVDIPAIARLPAQNIPFETQLRPLARGAALEPSVWTVRGTAAHVFTLDSTKIFFTGADALARGDAKKSKLLVGRIWDPSCFLEVGETAPNDLDCEINGPDSDGHFSLAVTPSADGKEGTLQSTINLVARHATGTLAQSTPITVSIERLSEITSWPSSLLLGAIPQGSQIIKEMTIAGDVAAIESVIASPSDGSLTPSIVHTSSCPMVLLGVKAERTIEYIGSLTITLQTTSGDRTTLSIPVSYYVIAGVNTRSPRTVTEYRP